MLFLIILLLLILVALGVLYIVYRIIYSPTLTKGDITLKAFDTPQFRNRREQIHRLVAAMKATPYEPVSIIARDGTRLVGRYYHHADGAPLDIGFHGYRGSPTRDFCGGAPLSFQLGHNLLLVEERSQCGSEGRCITFGILERWDCLDWLTYANERFGSPPITLYGVSMGATTVLMASALGLPDNVRGIIADCPFSAPLDIICEVGKSIHLPPALTRIIAIASARLYGGFDLQAASAAEAVSHATVPILIIHGEDDHFVPCSMSAEIAKNCASPCRYETFPHADHSLSLLTDPPRYEAVVRDFMAHIHQ